MTYIFGLTSVFMSMTLDGNVILLIQKHEIHVNASITIAFFS